MTAVSVGTSSTVILAPNQANRFAHIKNNSVQIVYLSWDGTTPTVANGYPIAANADIQLDGNEICGKGVLGIVAATTADVRLQVG